MNISKKWGTAAAAALTLALVGTGAVSANAATGDPLNPQPNGSKGSFYLWDTNTGAFADGDPTRVYSRSEPLFASALKTDLLAEINPAATRPVTGATPFTEVYRFLSEPNTADYIGGRNTWNAFAPDLAAGPNGGTLVPDFTLDAFGVGGPGGIADDIAAGGTYWYGVAYTQNNGVTPVGAVYREITIEAGTGNYTVGAVIEEGAPTEDPADLVVESELVAPETATLTTTPDSTVVGIDAGAANAGKTLDVAAFQGGTRVELGQVVFDAAGVGSVDVAGKGITPGTAAKLFAYEKVARPAPSVIVDETLSAWGTFTLVQTQPTTSTSNLTASVTASNIFKIVAPANPNVDLGPVRRNQTTAPVKLGQFSVIDDRDVLTGWDVNVSASDFTGQEATNSGHVIPAVQLGYAGLAAGGVQDGVTVNPAPKLAGEGVFGTLASGAPNSSTTEEGAHFDADLTFKAPIDAKKGVYNSTLTLTLVSK